MPVEFERTLNDLSRQAPNDPHLNFLQGDYEFDQDRRDRALEDYRRAAELSPQTAEAYYRMCVLYDFQRNVGKALQSCQKAADLSPLSPHYRANLAAQYFKHGEYDEAVREYRQVVDGYPSAKLELANILRLQGNLHEAREKEQLAIEELENDSTMASLPENLLPLLPQISANEAVSIPSRDQKLCYAHLELSSTLYLLGDEPQSAKQSDQAAKACGAQTLDIKAVLESELARVADEQGNLTARVEAFRRTLAAWPNR
jgi:hypothetical protein